MFEHKQPGKSTLTGPHGHGPGHGHGHDHRHDHGHAATPGKRTPVEQADHGPPASAASLDGGGPTVSTSKSASITVHDGPVRVETTVNLSLAHGEGPLSLSLGKRGVMTVGNDHMSFDVSSLAAAQGTKLGLTGASATVTKGDTTSTQVSGNGGVLTWSYATSYTVKSHDWTASLSVSSVGYYRPKPPEKPHGIGKVIDTVKHVLAAAGHIAAKVLKTIVDADVELVHSSREWGPALAESIAAAAAAGETIVLVP